MTLTRNLPQHKVTEQEVTVTSSGAGQEQEWRVVVSEQDPVCCCPTPNMTEYKLVVVGGQFLSHCTFLSELKFSWNLIGLTQRCS